VSQNLNQNFSNLSSKFACDAVQHAICMILIQNLSKELTGTPKESGKENKFTAGAGTYTVLLA